MKTKKLGRQIALIGLFAFSWIVCADANAWPIGGEIGVDIGLEPQGLSEGQLSKVDSVVLDAEISLRLSLTFSGLDVTNWAIVSQSGVEFAALSITANLPIAIRNIIIFAPNVLEVADDLLWTVALAQPDPGGLTGLPLRLFINELASPLDLAKLLGPALTGPLTFRKNIMEFQLAVTGLVLRMSLLMANLQTPQTPSLNLGLVISVAGQTSSGVYLETETYFGARQGFECFGECQPIERFFQGYVVSNFGVQQEALIARNLIIAGVTNNLELVFDIANSAHNLISKFDWEAKARLFNVLNAKEHIRLDSSATPGQALIETELSFGTTQLSLDLIDNDTSAFDFPIRQLRFTALVGDVTFRDVLLLQAAGGILHAIIVETKMDIFSFSSQTIFLGGILKNFYSQSINVLYRLGPLDFKMNVIVRRDFLLFFGMGAAWHF